MIMWHLILLSAVTAFIFRLIPFFAKNHSAINNQNGKFYRFLNYSAQAMLGVIIYDTAFQHLDYISLIQTFNQLDFMKLSLLIIVFIWVAKTKNMLLSFIFGLTVYLLFILFFN